MMANRDSIFKELFEDKEIFYDFLKAFLPKEITDEINVKDLKREQTELITKDYSTKSADILYKIEKKNGQDIYIYLLLEHQSSVDQLMAFRMLAYKVRIWEQYVKAHKEESKRKDFKLPMIIGIVFYDGEREWTSPTDIKDKIIEMKIDYGITNYELVSLKSTKQETLIKMNNALGIILLTDKPDLRVKSIEELIKMIREEIVDKMTKAEQEKFNRHKNAFIELFKKRAGFKEEMEEFKEIEEMEVPNMFDTLEKIAKRDREEAKLEERKELVLEILNQRFGKEFNKELEGKIRKANEEVINKIKKNILKVTIEELKEILK
jgi:predicted transposase/invertase (TIGR01784 family)